MGTETALLVDTGVLYCAADSRDPDHTLSATLLRSWQGELIVSAFVAAEADYLILDRLGLEPELKFIQSLSTDFTVELIDDEELQQAKKICKKYGKLELGLADASTVVLAHKWNTNLVATFDQRHFRTVKTMGGKGFELPLLDKR